eukprot:TCALIF_13382-PA protein Name:"Protein of unknown function" AED:0.00 eAED:0.00 QI:109/1/1/1/0/0.5/2/155/23
MERSGKSFKWSQLARSPGIMFHF